MKLLKVTPTTLLISLYGCMIKSEHPNLPLQDAFSNFSATVSQQTSTHRWTDVESLLTDRLRKDIENQRNHGAGEDTFHQTFRIPTEVDVKLMKAQVDGLKGCLLINGNSSDWGRVSLLISYERAGYENSNTWLIDHINMKLINEGESYIQEPECQKHRFAWD